MFMGLGHIAGVDELTKAALDHYDRLAEASQDGFRQKLRQGIDGCADASHQDMSADLE